MIEFRQFRHIAALAKHRNFRLAAETVSISQPALSLSIKAAEDALGHQLFIRSNKTIIPTHYGEIVIAMAHKVLSDVDNMERELDLLSQTESSNLKICICPYLHYSLSDTFIRQFLLEHPSRYLDLLYGEWDNRIAMLKNKQVDLLLEVYAVDPERKIFRETEIISIDFDIPPIVYFCRSGHPLVTGGRVNAGDLLHYDWTGEGGAPLYHHWLAEATGLPSAWDIMGKKQKFHSSDYHSILHAVLHSDMISAGSPIFLDSYEKEGLISYLNIDWKVPHMPHRGSILLLKDRPISQLLENTITAFLEITRELVAQRN